MKKQKLKATLALVLFLFSATGLVAQTQTITGTVYDEENARFAGVTVTVSGTSVRTSTDERGNFTVNAASNSSLTFTAIGYDAQTVPVGSRSQVTVTMVKSVSELGEVVVTAEFGMKRMARAVGSSVQQIDGRYHQRIRPGVVYNRIGRTGARDECNLYERYAGFFDHGSPAEHYIHFRQ